MGGEVILRVDAPGTPFAAEEFKSGRHRGE
jgi:hypothetical protein